MPMRKLLTLAAIAALPVVLSGCFVLAVGGMGTAALIADDRRTAGIYIEDENIEWKTLKIRESYANAHVNATSFNRKVLLTGEVPNEDTKRALGDAIRKVDSVVEVANEVQVAGASSLAARGNDSLLTTSVKTRMINNGKVSPTHVKVVTEAATVYLMGLVTQAEGDAAAEVARTTAGVKGVVKVFEYIK